MPSSNVSLFHGTRSDVNGVKCVEEKPIGFYVQKLVSLVGSEQSVLFGVIQDINLLWFMLCKVNRFFLILSIRTAPALCALDQKMWTTQFFN